MSLAAHVPPFDFRILQPVRWWNKSIFHTSAVSCGHLGVTCMYLVHTPSTGWAVNPNYSCPLPQPLLRTELHPGTDSQSTAIFTWHWAIFVKSVPQKAQLFLAQHWPFCSSLSPIQCLGMLSLLQPPPYSHRQPSRQYLYNTCEH